MMYMHSLLKPAAVRRMGYVVRHDIIAALVVTAIAIPQSLAFAAIAGLPPVTGLYTALLAPIVFGILARTKRLVVGADSATAVLVASGAALVAQAGTAGYVNAVIVLGLLVGVTLIIMALLRLGLLADLISRPVLVGFLAGVGVQLIIANAPALVGLSSGSTFPSVFTMTHQYEGVFNGMTATISLLVLGVIMIFRKSRIPGELVGLVLAGLFVVAFQAEHFGVQLVGALPSGLPSLASFHANLDMLVVLAPPALAIALVILAQSSLLIRTSAAEHDEKVALNRDLFALGAGNIAAAVTYGFTINGSPPRTIAADTAGGKTAFVNVWMGLCIGLILLFGSSVFTYIPQAALAAIVLGLGFRLIRFTELKHIWTVHRNEFWVAMFALLGTVLFGVLIGVCIAVVVSLTERLVRQYHPKDSILLRDGQLSSWAIERLGQRRQLPKKLLVYSFNGSLFFENIQYFSTRLSEAIAGSKHPVWSVVVDAGAMGSIDYTAVGVVESLYRQLSADGISLAFAHVSPELAEQFERYGLTTLIGEDNMFATLGAAIDAHSSAKKSVVERLQTLPLKRDQYVVVGSSVLDVLGLRRAANVDIVVRTELYDKYRKRHAWREFTQANGKKVLSHDGCNLMTTWASDSLQQLERDAFTVEGVRIMSIGRLIEGKQQLGRRKDAADITLLHRYQTHQNLTNSDSRGDAR